MANKKPKAPTAVWGVAPLALSLLIGNAVLPSPAKKTIVKDLTKAQPAICQEADEELTDFRDCHTQYPTGCSKAGKYDAYLNLLKNKIVEPTTKASKYLDEDDFNDLERNTPDSLTKMNHGENSSDLKKLGEGQQRGIVGYLYYVQKTGAESSNCLLTDVDDVDFHIGIGFDKALADKAAAGHLSKEDKKKLQRESIVVEMTPHYRGYFQPNWTLEDMRKVVGRQVKVEGQLLIDSEHYQKSQDCGIPGADQQACWRMSAWELHPVTKFQVCTTGDSCTQQSSNWAELENAGSGTVVASAGTHGGNH